MKKFLVLMAIMFPSAAKAADHQTGLIHQKPAADAVYLDASILGDDELPAKYDTTAQLPPVRNQGQCGSCWAFASTGALEGALAVKERKIVDLSEQQLVSCNSQRYSCNGGYFIHDMQVNPGQADETDFPYTARNARCKGGLPVREKIASWAFVGGRGRSPTVSELKHALLQNGPLAVTVTAGGNMQRYHGGVMGCDRGETNHMVTLVGWDDTQAKGVWIMRNSWGANWGEKGYGKIPFGCSKIAEEASTVVLEPSKGE